MNLEVNNNPEEDNVDTLKKIFKVSTLPKNKPELLDHSSSFSEETALQLIMYGNLSDWKWYTNMESNCKNSRINGILDAIYAHIHNPKYIFDINDLDDVGVLVYNYVIGNLSQNSEAIDTTKKIGEITKVILGK